MARFATVAALSFGAADALNVAQGPSRQAAFLSVQMRPDAAAKSLVAVEDEWQAEAQIFANCEAHGTQEALNECVQASHSFKKSCDTVVTAIMQGSSGQKSDVKEYLADVCGQSILKTWHKERCQSLAVAVDKVMSADAYENRQNIALADLCGDMWQEVVSAERERAEQEAKAEAEEEAKRKAEEEARAKAEADEAAAKAQAEAEAKAKAEEEAKKKAEEAKAKAEEAKPKAEEPKPKAEKTDEVKPVAAVAVKVAEPAKTATKAQNATAPAK
eukprot:TRINITY_DN2579_c0_g1_i1.p2 TRINITY_DN2579_c0_g1~~TRINITY_DN2579_c0_g1_i1.p2  ORF type:complete len:294 (-),score=133.79 TRINITY_DN2579_c0_g1_i1:142-960(-)